ncbi:MAG: hypothetical protein EA401_10925 [Planctomycetota bacterium]|nr:MAG: hypothetical protein EA401_10925 [Planctomycetota bacterium]
MKYLIQGIDKKVDSCQICGAYEKLTWDHVPPKSCVEQSPVMIKSLYADITNDKTKAFLSQNGLKFRTICGRCNSELGNKYDPELCKFTSYIVRYSRSRLRLPKTFEVPYDHFKLVKCLAGHYLASTLDHGSTLDIQLRKSYLGQITDLPVRIAVSLSSGLSTSIVKDVCRGDASGRYEPFFMSAIKWLPLMFLFSFDENPYGMVEVHSGGVVEKKAKSILLDKSRAVIDGWPEHPLNNEFILMNDQLGTQITAERHQR